MVQMSSGSSKLVAVLPRGNIVVNNKCRPFSVAPSLGAVGRRTFVVTLCCTLFALQCTAGMYISSKDSNNEDELRRHFRLRQQPFFALPVDAFDANTALVGVTPFTEQLVFEKRFAPREMGKRERIIMDAMGGNDYLIKRSFGKK